MEIVVIPTRHEVVNSPETGAVTWCQGPPFCPQCAPANPMPSGAHILPLPTDVKPWRSVV